jgi:hypothetical protein
MPPAGGDLGVTSERVAHSTFRAVWHPLGNSSARPSLVYPTGTATGVNGLLRWTPK